MPKFARRPYRVPKTPSPKRAKREPDADSEWDPSSRGRQHLPASAVSPSPSGRPTRTKKVKLDPDFVTREDDEVARRNVKPEMGRSMREIELSSDDEEYGGQKEEEEEDFEQQAKDAVCLRAELEAYGPRVIPPSTIAGRQVIWDPAIKTILTTAAKKAYRISDAYLRPLDREIGRSAMGYKQALFSEYQVQQAAYEQRGGPDYFRAYIERLQSTNELKAANKGEVAKPLKAKGRPLAPVSYTKAKTPKGWQDCTMVKKAKWA